MKINSTQMTLKKHMIAADKTLLNNKTSVRMCLRCIIRVPLLAPEK